MSAKAALAFYEETIQNFHGSGDEDDDNGWTHLLDRIAVEARLLGDKFGALTHSLLTPHTPETHAPAEATPAPAPAALHG